MKNIHVLPTDKLSRLVKNNLGIVINEDFTQSILDLICAKFVNIYITSDEEIKEGDYFIAYSVTIDKKPYISCASEYKERKKEKGKIILTTDQDLIKDGVQAIDDEFLEWFVKNPSCEFVETLFHYPTICDEGDYSLNLGYWTIIIPKEEAKKDLEKEMFELEQELDIPSHLRWHNSKPKQETLEEAANRLFFNVGNDGISNIDSFIKGAKWQQEKSYNELFEWLASKDYLSDKVDVIQKEFKQFKSK